MRRQRPSILTVLATLNIVFGALGVICGICGAGTFAFLTNAGTVAGGAQVQSLMDFMKREVPGYLIFEIGKVVLVLILGIILIVAGIGLLKVQSWARWTSVVYAFFTVLVHAGYLVFEFKAVVPAVDRFQKLQGLGFQAGAQGSQAGGTVGMVLGNGLFIVYALILLVAMLLPNVSEAFEGRRMRRLRDMEDDDIPRRRRRVEEDEEEDRPRRRRRDEEDDDE